MSDTITISDPEFVKMIEERGGPSMGDLPAWLALGRTDDGRTREDFEEEDNFEDDMLRVRPGP